MTEYLDFVYELINDLDNKEYKILLEKLGNYFDADRAFILNYYRYINTTDIIIGWQMSKEINEYLKEINLDNFKNVKEDLKNGKSIIINNVENDNKYPKINNLLNNYNKSSAILIPIRNTDNEIIGVLGLADNYPKKWELKKIKILKIIAYNLKHYWEDEILKFKYQSIIQNSASAIVILDNEGKIIELNKKFEKLAGCKKNELINNKCFFDFIDKTDREKMITRHKKRRQGLEVTSDYDFLFVNKKDTKKEVNVKVEMIPGTDKSVCSLVDITQKKETQNLIKLQEERLSESYNQLKENRNQLEKIYMDLIDKNIENERLIKNIEKLINLVSSLNISNENSLNNFLAELLYTALEIVDVADYGSVYIFNEDNEIEYIETVGHNLDKLNDIKIDGDPFIHSNNEIKIVDDILEQNKKFMDEYIANKIKEASLSIKQSIPVILSEKNNIFGGICIDIANGNDKIFTQEDVRLISSFKNLANTFFRLERYKRLNKQFNKEVVSSLLNFLSKYDIYTNHHSENVAELSMRTAEKLNLSNEQKNDVYWTGMLHDLGKLIIPANILNKKDSLTFKEYEIIKEHPTHCYQALSESEFLKDISIYVLYHHERWDGKGYPTGLKGEKIPLVSRIIALADAWDAMCSKRAYRDSLGEKVAKKEIVENKGKQFDPKIAEVFLDVIDNLE